VPALNSELDLARQREERARLSGGASLGAVYAMIASCLAAEHEHGATLLDVGCGAGALRQFVAPFCDRYVGTDLIRYDSFPAAWDFVRADLNGTLPLPEDFADIVIAAEVIEHLENPRALMRELVRVARPQALIAITTPNQLSLLSILTLIFRKRFAAFQDVDYPAHVTALLEVDLLRIAQEAGLTQVRLAYSGDGRIPRSDLKFPAPLSRMLPRAFSDNVMLCGRKSALRG